MAVINFRNPNSPADPDRAGTGNRKSSGREQVFIDERIEADEQSRKRRRQILRLLLRAAAVTGAAVLFILFVAYLASQRTYSAATYRTIGTIATSEDTSYLALGRHIVYYSKDGASCLSRNGSMIWSISYEMQKPIVRTAGDILAIGDYSGSTIYLENSDATIGTIDTSLPIRDLSVSESGEVAAVLADTDTTWVYLYNPDGTQIAYFRTTMSQSGYPISIAISPGGELVCVSHLLTRPSGISSSIAFYNFGNVGQNVAENNVSGFNYDNEIFPFTTFLSNSVCAAVSDSRIAFYNGGEIPESGANVLFTDELIGTYRDNGYIGLLFMDSSSGGYAMQIYNESGSLVNTVSFDMAYTGIHFSDGCIYINNDNDIMIYTIQGQLRFQGSFQTSVSQVIPEPGSSSRFYIVTDGGLEEMTLE